MSDDTQRRLDPMMSLMISLALASNAFFLKRLINDVDTARQANDVQRERLSDIQDQIAVINSRLRIVIKQIPPKQKPTVK